MARKSSSRGGLNKAAGRIESIMGRQMPSAMHAKGGRRSKGRRR